MQIESSLLYQTTAMQVFANLPGLRLIKSVQIFTQCGNYAFILVGILAEYVLNHDDSLLYNIIYLNSKVIQYTLWNKVSIFEVRNVYMYYCPRSFSPSMLKPSHLSKEMHPCSYTHWSSYTVLNSHTSYDMTVIICYNRHKLVETLSNTN